MLASLLIVFREVLEAGLIVGVVLAATEGVPGRLRWIAGGIVAGLAGAALLAAFAGQISALLDGNGQEAFTASVLVVAVVMLAWHTVTMAAHGRAMTQSLRGLGRSVTAGEASLMTMAVVVAVACLREGAEVVLFLYGVALSNHDGARSMLMGVAGGLLGGAGVAWVIFRGLLSIPTRHLFAVINALLTLLAAGMAGQAAAILAGIGLVPSLGDQAWDTSRSCGTTDSGAGLEGSGRLFGSPAGHPDRRVRGHARSLHGCHPLGRQRAADEQRRCRLARRDNMRSMIIGGALGLALTGQVQAREFYIGGPVHQHDMEIVANYLVGHRDGADVGRHGARRERHPRRSGRACHRRECARLPGWGLDSLFDDLLFPGEGRQRLEKRGHAAGDDRQGRPALCLECRDERAGHL